MSTINQPLAALQVSTLPLLTRLRLRKPSPLTPARSLLLRGRPISVPPIYSSDPAGNPPAPDAQSPNVASSSFSGSIPSQAKRTLSSFSVGEVVDGVVKNVVPFGCFVDVGGVEDFLVHVSDFADAFCKDPSKVVSKGDPVKLEIIQIMANKMKGSFKGLNGFEEKLQQQQVRSPSRRETTTPEKEYSTSEFFEGVVERVTVSGAIMRFDNGETTGFLPVEELPNVDTEEEAQPSADNYFTVGQKMEVRVMEYQSRNNIVLTTRSVEEEAEVKKMETEGIFISDIDPKDYRIFKLAFEKAGLISNMFDKTTEDVTEAPVKAAMESEISTADDAIVEIQNETMTQVETPPPPSKEEEPIVDIQEDLVAAVQEDAVLALPEDPVNEVQEEPSAEIKEAPVAEIQGDSSPVIPEETIAKLPEETKEETQEKLDAEIEEAPVDTAQEAPVDTAQEEPVDTAQEEPAAEIQEETVPVIPEAVADIPEEMSKEVQEAPVNELPEESIAEAEEAAVDETEEGPVSELEQAPSTEVQEAPPMEDAKPQISAKLVKELRDITGAGMLDCKKALTESAGDIQSAMEYLKKKGVASASKRAGRVASEGMIASYVHHGDKLGILLEVNSETDFVARNDQFKDFVNDVAMTIASCPEAICINPEDFPADLLEKEKEIELSSEELQTKAESIREKIVSGKLEKLKKTGSLLQQKFIRNQEITVQDALTEVTAALGEKISIRRFERFVLGEGLEKKSTAFATEVTDQIEAKIAEAAVTPAEDQEPVPESPAIPEQPEFKVSAVQVKELRVMTGGGMMDCKNALIACQGDLDAASEFLRKKGLAGAAKKADRLASEGAIGCYVHAGSKLGVMVEVNCETDFVSRSEVFKELVQDIKLMITACPEVQYITDDEIPQSVRDTELELEMQKEDLLSKAEDLRPKIAEGRLIKALKSFCLFDQPTLKDTNKTVREMIQEAIAALGENIRVRRFVRFNLGEGIEKEETNFADEVAQQAQTS